jgi:2-oxoglutarate dehydrogenase E1 component
MSYRQKFQRDILIDLLGYRRHGHNESDEPSYTQPLMYNRIKALPTVREKYAGQLVAEGVLTSEEADALATSAYQRLVDIQQAFKASTGKSTAPETGSRWWRDRKWTRRVTSELLSALNDQLLTYPPDFTVNPKLAKQLERRRPALGPEGGIDWAHREALALASLLTEGVPLRFTGQDVERGTFSQRQLVLHDVNTGATWCPLQRLPAPWRRSSCTTARCRNSRRLGFEYGYSAAAPDALVLWEAQFGDFINRAQVIIDQFLSSGLSKWGLTTRLTLLLRMATRARVRSTRVPGSSASCRPAPRATCASRMPPRRRSTSTSCGGRPSAPGSGRW